MLPPVLSILLHSSLPLTHSTHLRTSAAQTMSHLLTQHSTTYPSLAPRIMKTLLLALVSTGKSRGTREGAIRGLVGVGKDAIRKGLIEGHGAKVVAQESQMPGYSSLAETVMVRFGAPFHPYIPPNLELCATLGRVCHPVSPIEVAYTFKPCGR